MGQTLTHGILTHGIYLPDEGERNCYAGLAANWQLLDNSVGTIAEHTTALSGKAPLVHTHTKSDVTDLFNSANTWSALNTYSNGQIRIKSQSQEIGVTPSESRFTYCDFTDKNEISIGQVITAQFVNGYDTISLNMYNNYTNGVKDPNGTSVNSKFEVGLTPTGNPYLNTNGKWLCDLTPIAVNLNIGTLTNKWQSFNGVNPGALSLPDTSYTDIKEYITDRNYGANYYTAPGDGYVCVGSMASSLQISNDTLGFGTTGSTGQDGYASAYIPVRTGNTVRIQVKQTSTDYQYFSFYPCTGNV